jgi:hypothetical protein
MVVVATEQAWSAYKAIVVVFISTRKKERKKERKDEDIISQIL